MHACTDVGRESCTTVITSNTSSVPRGWLKPVTIVHGEENHDTASGAKTTRNTRRTQPALRVPLSVPHWNVQHSDEELNLRHLHLLELGQLEHKLQAGKQPRGSFFSFLFFLLLASPLLLPCSSSSSFVTSAKLFLRR